MNASVIKFLSLVLITIMSMGSSGQAMYMSGEESSEEERPKKDTPQSPKLTGKIQSIFLLDEEGEGDDAIDLDSGSAALSTLTIGTKGLPVKRITHPKSIRTNSHSSSPSDEGDSGSPFIRNTYVPERTGGLSFMEQMRAQSADGGASKVITGRKSGK